MKHTFTKLLNILLLIITCLLAGFDVHAQAYQVTSLQTLGRYRALTKDNLGNIFMVRENAANTAYEVVKLPPDGSGAGTFIYSPASAGASYPWGLAVNDNGDVFVTETDASFGWWITKLDAGTYTPHKNQQTGNYYAALAFDNSNRLLSMEFDNRGDANPANDVYKLVRYNAGQENQTPTLLYDGIACSTVGGSPATFPWSIAVDNSDNIYIFDRIENSGGKLLKLSPPNYNVATTISSGRNISTLTVDAQGNVYTMETSGFNGDGSATYHLMKYTAPITGPQTPVEVPSNPATTFSKIGTDYPWGIVVSDVGNIFVNDGASLPEGRFLKYTPPSIQVNSVNRVSAALTNAATVNYTVTFSGTAYNVTPAAFNLTTTGVTGASVTNVSGSGSTYTVTVNTGSGDGTLRLDVNGTNMGPTITNIPYTAGQLYTIDKTAPNSVSFNINNNAAYTNSTTANLNSITGNDPNGPLMMRYSVDGGTNWIPSAFEALATDKNNITLPAGDGLKTVQLQVKDGAGNITTVSDQITLDQTPPTITFNIKPTNPSNSTDATFSINVEVGATLNATLDGVGPSPITSPITFTGLSETSHTLSVTATDAAGNTSPAITYTWVIDTQPPSFVSLTPPGSGYYRAGMSLNFTVKYSENVFVTGTPSFDINIGGTTRQATYVSGAGTPNLVFRYTVVAGDQDMDGIGMTPTIALSGGTIKDQVGNNAPLALGTAPDLTLVRVKTDKPTVVVSMSEPSPINHAFTVTFTFSDPVTGFDNSDLTVSALSMTPVTSVDGGKTYTATVTPTVQGPGTIILPADKATDIAGNGNQAGSLSFDFDNVAPAISVQTIPSQIYKAGDVITVTMTYSETVIVTGAPYINLIIGSNIRQADFASGSGTNKLVFSYIVQAGEVDNDGVTMASITLNGGTIKDAANNNAGLGSAITFPSALVDAVPPVITAVPSPTFKYYKAGDAILIAVQTSENVVVTGTPRLGIDIGGTHQEAIYMNGSGTNTLTFSYTVVDGDNDNNGIALDPAITLSGATIRDAAGNNLVLALNGVGATTGVLVDTKHPIPTITSTGTLPATGPFTIRVTFDEDLVDDLTIADISLLNVTVGPVTKIDNRTWDVLLTPTVGTTGTRAVNVLPNTVNDAAGNGNLSALTPYSFSWDTKAPALTVTAPANIYYKAGDVVTFTVTYDENVSIAGTPTLPLIIDGTTHDVPMAFSTGTALTFNYTVATGEQDLNGVDLGAQIGLAGASIKDAAGNDAATGVANHYGGVLIDGRAPTITTVTMPPPGPHNGYYINELGTPLVFTVNTSETVSVSGNPTLDVIIGGVTRQAIFANNIGSQLIFTYNIVDGDNDEDGVTLGTQLHFPAGSYIRDAAGNNIDPTLNGVGDGSGVKVNTTHPDVTITPVTPSPYNGPFNIIIGFTEQVTDDLLVSGFDLVGGIIGNLNTSDHKTWTATFTPNINAEGAGHIQVRADMVHNTATNGNNASAVYNFNFDTKGPAIVSLPHLTNGTYGAGDVISFTFTFDEPLVITGSPILPVIIGATTHNVPVTSNTAGALTFSYTIAAGEEDLDGIAQAAIDLNGGTIKDALGNNAVLPTAFNNFPLVLVDAKPPVVTSVDVPANGYHTTTIGSLLTFTVHTSETVIVTGSPVFHVNIGGVDKTFALTGGSGTNALTFSYTVVSGDNDEDGIEVNNNTALDLSGGTIRDGAGNDMVLTLNSMPVITGIKVNTVIPSVNLTSTGPGGLLNAPFTVTATFSEPVFNFTAAGLTLTNATAGTPITSNNTSYDILITPIADGPVKVKVKAGAAVNMGTNPNTESNELDRFYDTNPPDVVSVTAAGGVYKAGDDIFFTLNTNEIVLITGTPLIPLTIGATAATAGYLDNDGTSAPRFKYTVQPGDLDLDGPTLGANLNLNGGTIRDIATNNITTPISGSFPTVIIDGVAPTVTSVDVSLDGYYNAGTTLDFRVHTSENINMTGSPTLHINIGGVDREASLISSSSNLLVFSYTVVDGDNDADGITLDNNTALDLKGGVITDDAGNNMVLKLNGVPPTAGIKVKTARPGVTITPATASPYNNLFNITIELTDVVTDDLLPASFDIAGGAITDIVTSDHKTWTAIFRPFLNTEATGHIQVKADMVHDNAGNGNAASNVYNFSYDTKPPSIVSLPHPTDGTYKAGDVLSFTFTFDEALVITGSPVLPVIIGGNTRNVPVTSNTAGVLTFSYTIVAGEEDLDGIDQAQIDLNGGAITDAIGNNARLPVGSTNFPLVLVDAVPPVVTSVDAPTDAYYKAGDILVFVVRTSENVVVTGNPSIDVTIGTVVKQAVYSHQAPTGELYFDYTVQPGDKDMDGVTPANTIVLNGGTIKDAAGNDLVLALNSIGSTDHVFVNTDIPSVVLSTTAPALVNAPFDVTITFSEEAYGFAIAGITATNATLSNLQSSNNTTWTVTVTPAGNGNVSIQVPANAATNIGGNPNTASNTLGVDYDGIAPAITAVDLPATATYKAGDVLSFTVHYSENVLVAGTPGLDIVMTSGTGQATYTGGSGSDALNFSYTVVNGDLDADGITLGANLQLNGGSIKDAAGNNALPGLHGVVANVVKVDATAPVIASVGVPAPGYYKNGNDLNFTVTFNENIVTTGSPVLEVLIGGATREATLVTSGTNSLTFRYNIQPGDQDLDGIELTTALKLNGATIKDAIGNDALLDLHNVGATTNVYVYSIVPAVTFSGIVTNAPFTLSVIFSEKVTGFDISDIQVTNATLAGFTTIDNITYTMTLTPIAQGTVTLKVPANAAVNVAGTGNAASSSISYYYDGTAPVISSVDVPANGYYKAGDVLSFTVHYSETVNVMTSAPQDLQLPLVLDGKTVYANFVSGGGTNGDLLFNYTVVDGDMDLNGINLGASLLLHNGWIRDASANSAVLTLNNVANTSQVRINTANPSVQIASAAGARINAPFTATITFSEAVTGFTAADITAVNATVSAPQTTDNTVYTVTVTPGTDGVLNLSIPANVAVNNAGNNNTASNSLGRTVDKTSPVINAQSLSVNNNAPVGTTVGTLTATDASNIFQDWTISSDPTGGAFAIDNTGKITVKNASLLDARAGTTVVLGVTVSDGLNTSAGSAIPVNVILAFVNKTPTLDAISNVSVCTGTDVHTIQLTGASAVEAGQTYTITATANQPYFDQLSVSTAGVLSYQLKNSVTTGTATITVTIKDDGGTANGAVDQLSRTFTITVNNLPAITISSDKGNSVSKGDVIHLTATGASTYSWTDIDGIISGQQTAVLEAKAKDNASYEVTATSAAGCIGTASISITVIEDFKVDATNILTPNGDGRNDKWVIRNLDSYPNNEVQVYDRSGRIVFQQRNYANDWLGTLNGKPLAEGTYYYILRINDGAKTAKGYITIIRDEQ